MKYFFPVIAIVFMAISGFLVYVNMGLNQQIYIRDSKILLLEQADNTAKLAQARLQEQNELLGKLAEPKPFPSRSSLESWCKNNTSYNPSTSYSEDAMRLMNLAREDGYFLGFVGVETTTDTSGNMVVKIPVYPYVNYSKFYVFNVAVVGESDIYLIDPARGTCLKTCETKAKFGWGVIK